MAGVGTEKLHADPVPMTLDNLSSWSQTAQISYAPTPGGPMVTEWVYAAQFQTHFGASSPEFYTFCVDLNHDVSVPMTYKANVSSTATSGTGSFQSTLYSTVSNPAATSSAIAYLYNTYGSAYNPDSAQAAGMQLVLWKLMQDGVGTGPSQESFSLGNFQVLNYSGPSDGTRDALGWAQYYLGLVDNNPSLYQGASSIWLDASASGTAKGRGQSVLSTWAPTATPEPATYVLWGIGMACLGVYGLGQYWPRRARVTV
jgi:hypothetical protein